MKYKNIITVLAATALCGTLIYWLCLLHWSIAVVLTSIVVLGAIGDSDDR